MGHGEPEETTWAERRAAQIGREIATTRKAKGWTAQRLSEECARVGYPIPRSTLANIETGRKRDLPVQELTVIARALGVSVVELVVPLTDGEHELIPGESTKDVWQAVRAFTGEGRHIPARPIEYLRQHEEEVHNLVWLGRAGTDEALAKSSTTTAAVLERLHDLRAELDRLGVTPPPLPPRLLPYYREAYPDAP